MKGIMIYHTPIYGGGTRFELGITCELYTNSDGYTHKTERFISEYFYSRKSALDRAATILGNIKRNGEQVNPVVDFYEYLNVDRRQAKFTESRQVTI